MKGSESPPAAPKPKFSVYQNPTFSASLTAASLRPSYANILIVYSIFLASFISLITMSFWEEDLVKFLTGFHIFTGTAFLIAKVLQAAISFVFLVTSSAIVRSLPVLNARKALTAYYSKKSSEKKTTLTDRQLRLLGLKTELTEKSQSDFATKPPKFKPSPSQTVSDALIPIRKLAFGYTPPHSLRSRFDQQSSSAGKKPVISPKFSPSIPYNYATSPASPWSRNSPGNAKGILTEEKLEEFLAEVDAKIMESEAKVSATPSPTIGGFGVVSPSSIASSTASGAARSTPLRPVRLSPGLHHNYTPPKKGEGDLVPPMSLEKSVETFEKLGVYPHIEQWRDCLRQWFSSVLLNPFLNKIATSHILVMQAASKLGANITINQVGCDSSNTTIPVDVSPVHGIEWQPIVTLDENGFLHQIYTSLVQARDGLMVAAQYQSQQIAILPLIQQCLDAITEHQRLKTLMKGEIIKGLLPQSTVPADYTFHKVKELAEGTCLKKFDYIGNGDGFAKAGKKWSTDVPTDSALLLYLFCAFLEYPKWMLHVDTASYSGAHSSKNPLFLGVLPPKDHFPEKYVAVISGVPYIVHPGACILSIGKERPPIFSLYWDKKLQFSLQGRTALWDSILLLCHRIKVAYSGIVRGIHLGSSDFDILRILNSETDY